MAGNAKPKEILATLDAMLRVVTPDHPFQPVLAASIDPHAWRAVFVQNCKALATACKKAGASNTLQEASDALHEFAAAIFGDSYFDRFHAARHSDRDAEEFGPDHEFFDSNPHWLEATTEAQPAKAHIQERLELLDEYWNTTCEVLSLRLEEGQYASVLPAVLALDGGKKKKAAVLGWLSPTLPGPNYAQRSRAKRVHTEAFVIDTLLPKLETAVQRAFPEKGRRRVRQEANKNLGRAAANVLAVCHLRLGWKRLLENATTVAALKGLLGEVRKALTKSSKRTEPIQLTGQPLLESLRGTPFEVLDPPLKCRWDAHLKNPAQMQAVISCLHMMADGYAAIGQDTLGERLRAASHEVTNTGWTEKAQERLWKFRTDLIAIHGSENWVHPPISTNKGERFRKPRKNHGWLVNPLLVLWDRVYKAL